MIETLLGMAASAFAVFAIFNVIRESVHRDERPERVDHAKIHRLEYELGFREDPPSPTDAPGVAIPYRPSSNVSTMLKELYLQDGEYGAVIQYDRKLAETPAGRAALDREVEDFKRQAAEFKRQIIDEISANPFSDAAVLRRRYGDDK